MTSMTSPPTTCSPLVCTPARFGTASFARSASTPLPRWLVLPGALVAARPDSFRRGFDSLLLLVSWEVWKERNRRTFDSASSTPSQLLQLIRDEGNSWIAAGFRSLAPLFAAAP
jgi:hypothetical protein